MNIRALERDWWRPSVPLKWRRKLDTLHRGRPGVQRRSERPELRFVCDPEQLNEVRILRKQLLGPVYPEMDLDNDPLDEQALILYGTNAGRRIKNSARLSVEGPHEFPQEQFLGPYRDRGWRLCEWGRLAIEDGDWATLKAYYRAIYTLSHRMGCQAVVMSMKQKDIEFHQRLIGVNVVEPDMNLTYGGEFRLACVVWELENTKQRFFKWSGATRI